MSVDYILIMLSVGLDLNRKYLIDWLANVYYVLIDLMQYKIIIISMKSIKPIKLLISILATKISAI